MKLMRTARAHFIDAAAAPYQLMSSGVAVELDICLRRTAMAEYTNSMRYAP